MAQNEWGISRISLSQFPSISSFLPQLKLIASTERSDQFARLNLKHIRRHYHAEQLIKLNFSCGFLLNVVNKLKLVFFVFEMIDHVGSNRQTTLLSEALPGSSRFKF